MFAVRVAVLEERLDRLHVRFDQPRSVRVLSLDEVVASTQHGRVGCGRSRLQQHEQRLAGGVRVALPVIRLRPSAVGALSFEDRGASRFEYRSLTAEQAQAPQSPRAVGRCDERRFGEPLVGGGLCGGESFALLVRRVVSHADQREDRRRDVRAL